MRQWRAWRGGAAGILRRYQGLPLIMDGVTHEGAKHVKCKMSQRRTV
jgi:hypothetical protein